MNVLQVDGEQRHLPISDIVGTEVFLYAGHTLRVKTSFGLSIFLDERGQIKVKVPTQYEYVHMWQYLHHILCSDA